VNLVFEARQQFFSLLNYPVVQLEEVICSIESREEWPENWDHW
jgi:hypothetical protein